MIDTKSTFAPALHHFLDAVLEANRSFNLTSVRDKDEAWNKHIVDSLQGLQTGFFDAPAQVIDIGTGAGFPGMPLALVRPTLQMTLLDSTAKKCDFIRDYVQRNQLEQRVKVLLGRAEEWARDGAHRERYDIAITRAVGSFGEVCELTLPFVKTQGHVVLWRGKEAEAEIKQHKKVLLLLGAQVIDFFGYTLPGHDLNYHLITLQKIKPISAKYPRRTGLPKKQPLR